MTKSSRLNMFDSLDNGFHRAKSRNAMFTPLVMWTKTTSSFQFILCKLNFQYSNLICGSCSTYRNYCYYCFQAQACLQNSPLKITYLNMRTIKSYPKRNVIFKIAQTLSIIISKWCMEIMMYKINQKMLFTSLPQLAFFVL